MAVQDERLDAAAELDDLLSKIWQRLERLDAGADKARQILRRLRPGLALTRSARSSRRESHARRPGHRRVTSTRAGPDDGSDSDEPGPSSGLIHLGPGTRGYPAAADVEAVSP